MAVDTAAKRYSMLGSGLVVLSPVPDGDLTDAGDREDILGLYSGFQIAEEVPPAVSRGRSRHRRMRLLYLRDTV